MTQEKNTVALVFDRLYHAFGAQGWWPAETPFEMMVGAVLTQHTAWANVEKALARLKEGAAFTPKGLLALPEGDLAERIRPAGIYRVKARRLRSLLRFFVDRFGGEVEEMARSSDLRRELLAVDGIGPETADCIVLYAAGQPSFVVDAYTRRIFCRLGLIDDAMAYEGVRSFFMAQLPEDTALFGEYHALLVALGKSHCRSRPRCGACPLGMMCRFPGGAPAVPPAQA